VAAFEQLIAAELTHPAIAAPLATGIVGAAAYVAMDYVAAESLDLAVREYGPAPPADALRVAAQLAGALDFAAVVNVVHGAIHPRDVLLSSDDTRLTGIGIVRALQTVGVNAPIRRPYTAPERVAGRPWDRRADVFTLAALTHELLWGRRIVGAGHGIDGLPELPAADQAALRDVFARAFAEDPADRYATALEFADALKSAFPDVATVPIAPPTDWAAPSEAEAPVLGNVEGLALSNVEGLVLSDVEGPALSEVEGPALSDVEGPALSEVEGRLPLEPVAPHREDAVPVAAAPVASDVPELKLRAPEEPRYRDRDPDPSTSLGVIPSVSRDERVALPAIPSREPARPRLSMIFGAIAAALAIGIAVGYGVGLRRQPPAAAETPARLSVGSTGSGAPAVAASAPAVPPAREATEVAVGNAGRAAPPPAPATPVGAPVAKQPETRAQSTSTPQASRPSPNRVADRRAAASRSTPARPTDRTTDRRAATSAAAGSGTVGRFVGHLSVDSRPDGARVFLDGRPVGTTPLEMPTVGAGEHAIRLEREGYRRWSSSIRIVASEKTRVTASLER